MGFNGQPGRSLVSSAQFWARRCFLANRLDAAGLILLINRWGGGGGREGRVLFLC